MLVSDGIVARLAERRGLTPAPDHDLSLLKIESRFDLPRIVQALHKRSEQQQGGTLCFHGTLGTGKTVLEQHVAKAL